jgi:hypothetical protein
MAAAEVPRVSLRIRWARKPFYFNSAAHLLRILPQQAGNLAEFLDGLRTVTDDSIFQHTFPTLQEHHFIREGFSNDFSQWLEEQLDLGPAADRVNNIDIHTATLHEERNSMIHILHGA